MDVLGSRDYEAEIFVGPAQCGKTQGLLLNWLAYSVKVDPMDMIMYNPTKGAARDFSMRRIDRMHRDSKEIGAMMLKKRDADNKFDKLYQSGIILTLSHPSVTEFAGRPIGRVALTDYDRMADDIEGDGSAFDLAKKRTTTFGTFAMTLAESSPSRPITDTKWIKSTAHQAPPCEGILGLYNRGDRRRRYWPCKHCGEYFEANFRMLRWDVHDDKLTTAETVRLECPLCGKSMVPQDREEMDTFGIWLKDGQKIDKRGRVSGTGLRTNIASFWLNGVAAAFTTWKQLVITYLTAEEVFDQTGSQEALKKFYNTDLGEPYVPKGIDTARIPEALKSRAEPMAKRMVPHGVRFLVANVDVQQSAFVVLVLGIMPGRPFDTVVVDTFNIQKSHRLDEQDEHLWVKPATYLSDWDLIEEQVMDKTYELDDGSARQMAIKLTLCDSGGREGVTTNAYNFWRKLRQEGKTGRFHLVKGTSLPSAPRTEIRFPDSNRRDIMAVARGDVPVLMLASNVLKDSLAGRLDSMVPGTGMYRIPSWVSDKFYAELCAEIRSPKGWENPKSLRNEAWDLSYYCLGGCVSVLLQVEHIDWDSPPLWAADWDKNPLIFEGEGDKPFANETKSDYDFGKLGEAMA